MGAIIYRRHYCQRKHRESQALAKCLWPKHLIFREGPYATLSCDTKAKPHYRRRNVRTVMLHRTLEAAQEALDLIDRAGCGGRCYRDHKLIDLSELLT